MYGFYGFYGDSSYLLFMIISLAISLYAQIKVSSAFKKYSAIRNSKNITGAEAAERVLDYNCVSDVEVNRVHGYFSDYYDSRTKGVYLSDNVYDKPTLAAVSVAAHECGHATQDNVGYFPLRLRHMMIPVTQISSRLAMPLIFIGFLLPTRYQFMVYFGILLFSIAVLFQVVTLPVEFDASRRALKALKESHMLNESELVGAKKVLTAAALTYLAATFTALLSLLRFILIAKNRRK